MVSVGGIGSQAPVNPQVGLVLGSPRPFSLSFFDSLTTLKAETAAARLDRPDYSSQTTLKLQGIRKPA